MPRALQKHIPEFPTTTFHQKSSSIKLFPIQPLSMNIKLVIRMGLAMLCYAGITTAWDQQKGVEKISK
jgi:hypothetical protein